MSDSITREERSGRQSKQLPDAKECKVCGKWLPIRHFAPTGSYIKSLGRKCHDDDEGSAGGVMEAGMEVLPAQPKPARSQRIPCRGCQRLLGVIRAGSELETTRSVVSVTQGEPGTWIVVCVCRTGRIFRGDVVVMTDVRDRNDETT